MVEHYHIRLSPFPLGVHLITDRLLQEVKELPEKGLMNLFIQHSSAALALNENADPNVRRDLESYFERAVPWNEPYYTHVEEGPDDMPAHIRSILVGPSLSIPIDGGSPDMGVWQGVYLCEFRQNASGRKLVLSVYS
ncbi:MAG: secondary thiamine-phosphate synthase enzyme YjbQ [Flavobacteriales bacterium]